MIETPPADYVAAPPPAPTLAVDTSGDAQRRADLRRMKLIATGMLCLAAAVYLVCRWLEQRDGANVGAWVGYVRAASEAGMVGALADWFAVTALFRHPLGIPIPHTALIRKKKDQIGDQLGDFIRDNFLTPDVLEEKVVALELPKRVSTWLADPANAPRIADESARVVALWAEILADEDIEKLILAGMRWAAEPEWAPPSGRMLEQLISEQRLAPLIQLACDRVHDWAQGSQELIDRVIDKDAPTWAPRFLNLLVGERIHRELVEFTYKVKIDPEHEMRKAVDDFLMQLAVDLQNDPETIARFESLKSELIGRDEVSGAASTAWIAGKAIIVEALEDKNSSLRNAMSGAVVQMAGRVRDDAVLQEKLSGWTIRGARHVAEHYPDEIISVVTETIRRWDAEDASKKIELQVGRDLQFIRINGTVVGSLAGLVIYTISVLLFGG
ncbi:DUF445 family protein [Jongsikchunia kroppenstedtii]|uniref:DUF445 domain-containing protein n=1 Tax=Jongsikchunia kroppenstedtii TaxID=1121721 RepID=UPI000369EDFD